MVSDNFQPPSAIPPRTSSTSISNGFPAPRKSLLKPVPEADWMAGKKLHTTATSSDPPGPNSPQNIGHELRYTGGKTWSQEKEKILLGPYDYMVDHPGKDIRKQMIAAFNVWLKVPEESLAVITKVVGMLHTASLLSVRSEDSPVPVSNLVRL